MKGNKVKLITEILAIVIIVLVSFVGVYKQDYNKMINKVKEFTYSKDLDGYREVVLEVSNIDDTETNEESTENNEDAEASEDGESNSQEKETEKSYYEEYKEAKKIIEKRLKLLGVQDYNISQNGDNGSIYLQIPENENTDHVLSNLLQIGNFEIKDSEDSSKVFINNDNLKKVSTVYNTTANGTTVYLQFDFDKNGKKTLKDLSSGEYKTNTEDNTSSSNEEETSENNSEETAESTENSETEQKEENKQKKIILAIDDSDLITSSFDDVMETGSINLSMNRATTDQDSINETLKSASTIANILNSGKMPLTYEIKQNAYIQSDITKSTLSKICFIISIIFAVCLIYIILKFKSKGIIAVIANIGFIALDLLLVRYANVSISLESIVVAVITALCNYLMVYEFLSTKETKKTRELLKSQIIKAIPILLIAIIFTFSAFTKLSTAGMFLFWSVTLSFIYNYTLTRDMIK